MIINTLKLLMEDYNINQSRISAETGITRPTLLSLIRNENKSIRYDVIEQICKLFNVYMENFLLYSPITIEIVDFEFYFFENHEEDNIIDFVLLSKVKMNNEIYEFEHIISDINNNSFAKYEATMVSYVDYEKYVFLVENKAIPILNVLIRLKENYKELLEEINYSLNDNMFNSMMNIEIHYSIKPKTEGDNAYSIIEKIKNLNEFDKEKVIKYVKQSEI
ncbi:helix-turn-helix domain-containing protein [Staphylococcus equorum]|uniref:helix-turn-helix domain-containing protein n=1 Tax=Staphylococcus equorum TaxID=246432 RepID=UPI002DB5BF2E|nr:helix-turn-helix transcriptional regulator [Staphylococcus equorum]MEB7675180.1 helix-turn-helix transcriptional regulator [Staphylococcus equorum]